MSWDPLFLSFRVAFLSTLIAALLGVALAFALSRSRSFLATLLDALLTAPMVLPPTVLGYYVLVVLGRESALGKAFEALTGTSIVFSKTGLVVAATLAALPFVVRSSRAAFEDVDPTFEAAARTLGARPLRVFLTVTLPLASSGVIAGLTLGFARCLGDFGVTLMVAGNIPGLTQTGALAVYDAVQANRDPEAAGMVAVMTSLAVLALYAVNRLTRRRRHGF
jgi:molybdate transport system permease protein